MITGTIAKPSNPSVKLTPLDVPIITKKAKKGKNIPKSNKKSLKKGNANLLIN